MIKTFKQIATAARQGDAARDEVITKVIEGAANSKHVSVLQSIPALDFYSRLLGYGKAYHLMNCLNMAWAHKVFNGIHGGVSNSALIHFLSAVTPTNSS